ncbi:MAG: ATP-dependent RecD-like DNA helicase [Firmicutes bacterium]|nr:ATP-dependent RecD-like DNA helicase [Bacillota bacterium]
MTFNGTVENIVFRNEDNGYTVIDFRYQGMEITAYGIFPDIRQGESLTLEGEFKESNKYGKQFEVASVSFHSPTDTESLVKFLCSGLFRGVGEMKARSIVNKFGLKTLEIMDKNPLRLSEAPLIGRALAHEIGESYQARRDFQKTVMFLQKHGVTLQQSFKIYNQYKDDSVSLIKENPYRIVDDIDGMGFLTADKIAVKLGVDLSSDFRTMAGISYLLQSACGEGHTCLPRETLISETIKLLSLDSNETVIRSLDIMLKNRKIATFSIKNKQDFGEECEIEVIALSLLSNTENAISAKLIRIASTADALDINVANEINAYESGNRIKLHAMQRVAVETAVSSGAMVVTGGPGTGKTTIIKCILELLNNRGKVTALCAPTGRASKRLSEATGAEAKTVHRLLKMKYENGKIFFFHNELNPLDADIIIADEISMADVFVFNALLKAIPSGARLIIVGDKDQLPSVSAGNILSDIIESGVMPVISLTEIYRQCVNSLIVSNAHRINRGEMPVIDNSSLDFFVDNKEEPKDILASTVSLVANRITAKFGIPKSQIQVLAPTKKGIAGVENLNSELQKALNPAGEETIVNNIVFRHGDKVMHTQNNYNLKWKRNVGYMEEGEGVFNGDIGYIIKIYNGIITVEFEDGRIADYEREDKKELILAYAVSVHKSQGSEFSAVIIALSSSSYMLASRNLLYTAVTRAKSVVVIVGPLSIISRMVKNDFVARRFTLLKEFIWLNQKKAGLLTS